MCVCVSCRDQLESEKRRREAIQKEKEEMEREKMELMMRLQEFEETTKRAERGEAQKLRQQSLYCPLLSLCLTCMKKFS